MTSPLYVSDHLGVFVPTGRCPHCHRFIHDPACTPQMRVTLGGKGATLNPTARVKSTGRFSR